LIFCDVIARLSDAAALDLQNPSVYRIGALSSGLIKSIFASGMLANVTCQIINNMLREPDEALLPEIVEIGYCHTSVLEQAEHILQILDYMLTDQHWLDQDSKARSSLQACHLFASHLNTTRNNTQVWAVLRNEVLENEKDLATIIATLRA